VGRFDPQKDHVNLLAALAYIQRQGVDLACVLVGTGLDADNTPLLQQIEQAGLQSRVRLLGRRNDISAVMNALDVHVLSSSAEAFPNVLAEAMACGTPCVTTDVGDAPLIVGDTGWVVPPRNAEALADAIESALSVKSDPGWNERKHAARLRIEQNFSIERMVAAYNEVWREALL
jgi:glycosyltransferase involved in cell wall biosynthesis